MPRIFRRTGLLAVLATVLATLPAAAGDGVLDRVREHRRAHEAEIVVELAELVAIPNVASDAENIRRNARHIGAALEARGVAVEIWELDDAPEAPPIVYGRLDAPGATRTLGVYVHYDGQPVDPDEWKSGDPWEPTLYTGSIEEGAIRRALPAPGEAVDPEWRLYGRASGDDKAPIAAILAALDAMAAEGIEATSNLVFFFEGEEEAGSPHLEEYMRSHRDELGVDGWLVCDGPVHQSRRPLLAFGVRGYSSLALTTYGATRYLHSGHYGNWAPNPAFELARVLVGMKDADGRVLVEGFYDSTVPPGEAERRALESVPDVDEELRRELGLAATEMDDAPLVERLLLPSLNVRGMKSAEVGDRARNVIPTTATASIDVRLAKGNDPVEMLDRIEDHLRSTGYHVVGEEPDLATRLRHSRIVRMERSPGYPAARTALDSPLAELVIAAAERAAEDPLVLLPTMGGSLPLYLFEDVLGAPVVIVPIANHDDNQHAPDENLRLANLWYGVDLMAALFTAPAEGESP